MVRISGERAIEVDREMVFVNEPKPSDFIDVQNIIEENKDVFSTDDLDITVDREITSSTENENTTYEMHENVKITENHPPDYDPWESSPDPSPPSSTNSQSKQTVWEIHYNEIDKIISRMARNLLLPSNKLPIAQARICLGHDVINCIIKDKDKRKRARVESERAINAYSKLEEYRDNISSSIGLNDKNNKFRFIFRVFHVNNHKNCENFEIKNDLHNSQNEESLNKKIKTCLGHVDYLGTFLQNGSANQALRNQSHNTLEFFKSKEEIKTSDNSTLETHAFSRIVNNRKVNDLFVFYQHKDDCEVCDRCCFAPQPVDKLVSGPQREKELNDSSAKANENTNETFDPFWEKRIEIAEKEAGLDIQTSNSDIYQASSKFENTRDFSKGYKQGFIQGVKDSGAGWKHLATEFIKHPLDTTDQVINVFRDLSDLALTDQWGELSEALSPEAYKLATEWNNLSSEERGQLAGYAMGKVGTDIFIPGAATKLASRGVKGANKLLNISNSLQEVEGALALEGAAIERGVKISEAITANHEIVQAAEKLGLSAQEALNLKQAWKAGEVIDSSFINFVAKNEIIKTAVNEGRHVKFIRDYFFKSTKEIEKAISSFDKQASTHQEKISNPTKFCSEWNDLHPLEQKALIEKNWPTEIKCFIEQKNILQSILDEKVNQNV